MAHLMTTAMLIVALTNAPVEQNCLLRITMRLLPADNTNPAKFLP